MKIFTVKEFKVINGGIVKKLELANGTKITSVLVGEKGRNRTLGVVPTKLTKQEFDKNGEWYNKPTTVLDVELTTTRAGKPKFVETDENSDKSIIVVAEFGIGYRGSNSWDIPEDIEIITEGKIAQGDAGRMGSGYQYIFKINKPATIKIHKTGRLYGRPSDWIVDVVEKDGKLVPELFTGEELELLD